MVAATVAAVAASGVIFVGQQARSSLIDAYGAVPRTSMLTLLAIRATLWVPPMYVAVLSVYAWFLWRGVRSPWLTHAIYFLIALIAGTVMAGAVQPFILR